MQIGADLRFGKRKRIKAFGFAAVYKRAYRIYVKRCIVFRTHKTVDAYLIRLSPNPSAGRFYVQRAPAPRIFGFIPMRAGLYRHGLFGIMTDDVAVERKADVLAVEILFRGTLAAIDFVFVERNHSARKEKHYRY